MGKINKRKIKKLSLKDINKEKFVFVIGIARTGTSLCASILNQSPVFYLAYEHNNLLIGNDLRYPSEDQLLPKKFNGNKICIFRGTKSWYIQHCVGRKEIIMHSNPERSKDVKVVFTFRRPLASVVSSFIRLSAKRSITIENCAETYMHGIGVIRSLKEIFPDHHIFRFENAFDNDIEAKKLFQFCEEDYDGSFFSDFVSIDHYAYQSISTQNILTGKKSHHFKMLKDAEMAFKRIGVNPGKIKI